jgi:hypothetical protein
MATELFIIMETFSSAVSLLRRSFTRASVDKEGSLKGYSGLTWDCCLQEIDPKQTISARSNVERCLIYAGLKNTYSLQVNE